MKNRLAIVLISAGSLLFSAPSIAEAAWGGIIPWKAVVPVGKDEEFEDRFDALEDALCRLEVRVRYHQRTYHTEQASMRVKRPASMIGSHRQKIEVQLRTKVTEAEFQLEDADIWVYADKTDGSSVAIRAMIDGSSWRGTKADGIHPSQGEGEKMFAQLQALAREALGSDLRCEEYEDSLIDGTQDGEVLVPNDSPPPTPSPNIYRAQLDLEKANFGALAEENPDTRRSFLRSFLSGLGDVKVENVSGTKSSAIVTGTFGVIEFAFTASDNGAGFHLVAESFRLEDEALNPIAFPKQAHDFLTGYKQ